MCTTLPSLVSFLDPTSRASDIQLSEVNILQSAVLHLSYSMRFCRILCYQVLNVTGTFAQTENLGDFDFHVSTVRPQHFIYLTIHVFSGSVITERG